MAETPHITHPTQLSDLTLGLSNLSLENARQLQLDSTTQKITLALLQPLADVDMLATCRNPDSRIVRKPNGVICGTSNNEYLDIRPLSLAWRQAWTKLAPISNVTFDLGLPNGTESTETVQKVYWDTSIPDQGGLAVFTQDVMTLVNTLATEMRMRAGGDLQFQIIYLESEGVGERPMKLLRKQLAALAVYESPRKEDGDAGDAGSK